MLPEYADDEDDDVDVDDELVWPSSSAASFCRASASAASAESTESCNEVVSSRASTWPFVTDCPTRTSTRRTMPDTGKDGVTLADEVIVPDASTTWVSVARPTVA